MVAQLRSWLPNPIGGIYWLYLDNQYVSTYVPIYAGVEKISPFYKTYDPDQFTEDSARWVIDFVDNLLYLRWQDAIKDLRTLRDPLEAGFFQKLKENDNIALELFNQDPRLAKSYLTDLTSKNMSAIVDMYKKLRVLLITKYTNNKFGL